MDTEENEMITEELYNDDPRVVKEIEQYCKSVEKLLTNLHKKKGTSKWRKQQSRRKNSALIASNRIVHSRS